MFIFAFVLNANLMKYFCLALALALSVPLMAQQQSPEDQEKKLRESIETMLEKYEQTLELEYWQVFYLDSIMTHDYGAMMKELESKSKAKVENSDIYIQVQDKWNEQMYNSFRKVLNEEQWNKYLKQGAARDKKSRDKRQKKRTDRI